MGGPVILLLAWMAYGVAIYAMSRRRRIPSLAAPEGLFFVVLVPCLNEELVIEASLRRLLSLPGRNAAVVVIDDGSDDRTAELVRPHLSDRVLLFRRTLPDARRGKGEALNAALRFVERSPLLRGRRPQDVVVCILDADGRLSPGALYEVAPYFRDPSTGAVQIGVRIYNRGENLLARLQDLEFVTFTEVFQRGRQRIGSVGLGGNGQFTRLCALRSLGENPWSDCLTEDLELGVRLLAGGWRIAFCPTAHVAQQGVLSVRRLIRQRARWFQGHLQCWRHIPTVLRSDLPMGTTADLLHHLASPAMVLLMSVPVVAFPVLMATYGVGRHTLPMVGGDPVLTAAVLYVLAFGFAPLYGFAYWLKDERTGLLGAVGLAHLYTLYSYLWFPAGWIALAKIATRRRGWAKTERTVDAAGMDVPAAVAAA